VLQAEANAGIGPLAVLYRSKPQLFESFSKQADLLQTTIGLLEYADEFFEKAGLMVGEAARRLRAVEAQAALQEIKGTKEAVS